MGKKKRRHPNVEEVLSRPWCYYCERDFDDLKILISHQKAKHFKCDRCGRRLNTAGGLSVHMNQVHKENLSAVENALPNRSSLDFEIFGMEGVPEDVVATHSQRVLQQYYEAEAERRAATGNPPPGTAAARGNLKKVKVESSSDLKRRLSEHISKQGTGQPLGGGDPRIPATYHGQSHITPPATFDPAPEQGGLIDSTNWQSRSNHEHSGQPATLPLTQSNAFNRHSAGMPASSTQTKPIQHSTGIEKTGILQNPDTFTASSGVGSGPSLQKTHNKSDAISEERKGQTGVSANKAVPAVARRDKDKNYILVYSDKDLSPEEKMASLQKYDLSF